MTINEIGHTPYNIPGRHTTGHWATETESRAALDNILNHIDYFRVYREVCGAHLQPRLGQPTIKPRIDYILSPSKALLATGWPYGPIGIEAKKSGENIGPPLSQLLDYSRSAFEIQRGFWVMLQWVFLWPMSGVHGPLLSVFAQNRVGLADTNPRNALTLSSGQTLATFGWDHTVRIGAGLNGAGTNGRKAGSR